jgi:hypothetical protein
MAVTGRGPSRIGCISLTLCLQIEAMMITLAPSTNARPPVGHGFRLGSMTLAYLAVSSGMLGSAHGYEQQLQIAETPARWVALFEPGGTELTAAGTAQVLDLASDAQHPWSRSQRILLFGHTDTVGDPEANLVLSCQRALAIRDYLVATGIPADRVVAYGRGEADLAVPTGDDVQNEENRRVVMMIEDWSSDGSTAGSCPESVGP